MDNPTVPKADTTSNASGKKAIDSEVVKRKMNSQTVIILMVEMAKERKIISSLMVRPKIAGSVWDRMNAIAANTTTINVVNLMPDAVEALPAPMNIKIIVNRSVGSSITP